MVTDGVTFWDIMSCIPLKINQIFGDTCRFQQENTLQAELHAGFLHGLFFKPEGVHFSETSVDFQRLTRHCIPEDRTAVVFLIYFPPYRSR
jgi:hypothetical protein